MKRYNIPVTFTTTSIVTTFPQQTMTELHCILQVLRTAIKQKGTDEDALTRVIVTRAEVDLEEIKDLYYKRNSVTLENAVAKETSGPGPSGRILGPCAII